MALTFRASSKNDSRSADFTLTKPAGTVEGDLLIIGIVVDVPTDPTTPTGFTSFGAVSGTSMKQKSYYKIAGDSEPATYTIDHSNAGGCVATISAFYNSEGVSTWTLESERGDRTYVSTIQVTGNITTVNNSLLIINFGNDDLENVVTAPTDMTQIEVWSALSVSIASYYELKDLDTDFTKSITWTPNSEELLANIGVFTSDYTGPPADTVTQINIGDTWKEIEGMKINIGDVWKTVEGLQVNIGDDWKTVF